jgi:dipeptidyl aminopeptidase/acylaminoacyl peptidase
MGRVKESMKSLVLHGKGSSPEKIEWLASPLRGFGEVIVPEFEVEVTEGVQRALKYDFDLVAGHSRGGLIALIAGALKGKPVIAVSAPVNRRMHMNYLSTFPEGTPQNRIYKDLQRLPPRDLDLSPLQYARSLREVLLIHGTKDEVVIKDHSVIMCDEIRRGGGNCELHLLDMKHSPSGEAIWKISEIVREWVGRRVLGIYAQ